MMKWKLALLFLLGSCASVTMNQNKTNLDLNRIADIGAKSLVAKYSWPDRGVLPIGYYKGMAVSYAKALCSPLKTLGSGRGSLEYYGLSHTTRNLFAMLIGLGPRESSGKHCCGRDVLNPRPSSEGAEAGLFQTSWNARNVPAAYGNQAATDEMKALYASYLKDKSKCFLEFYKEGVTCSPSNQANYGSGDGAAYQKLSKDCPNFHLEFTALTILNTYKHHGPILRKKVTILPLAYQMLDAVETFVKDHGCGGM